MIRSIFALLSGVATGGLIVGLIRTLALNKYPLPENISGEEVGLALASMPNEFYFFIIGSHIIAAFAAGLVAAVISKKNKISWGLASAAVILIFTAYSNYHNENPDWVKLIDISTTALAGYVGAAIPRKR